MLIICVASQMCCDAVNVIHLKFVGQVSHSSASHSPYASFHHKFSRMNSTAHVITIDKYNLNESIKYTSWRWRLAVWSACKMSNYVVSMKCIIIEWKRDLKFLKQRVTSRTRKYVSIWWEQIKRTREKLKPFRIKTENDQQKYIIEERRHLKSEERNYLKTIF